MGRLSGRFLMGWLLTRLSGRILERTLGRLLEIKLGWLLGRWLRRIFCRFFGCYCGGY